MDFTTLVKFLLEKTMNPEYKGSKPFWALLWAVIFLVVYWCLPDLLAAITQMRGTP